MAAVAKSEAESDLHDGILLLGGVFCRASVGSGVQRGQPIPGNDNDGSAHREHSLRTFSCSANNRRSR